MITLPPCGLYKTTAALNEIEAGRLVYFHNHGDPGPGVYTPHAWKQNRASFHERGTPLPSPEWVGNLLPLPAEGLYRVEKAFTCCEKQCVTYAAESLVQLGYDAKATPILFVPEWNDAGFALPERGTQIDLSRTQYLVKLAVPDRGTKGPTVH